MEILKPHAQTFMIANRVMFSGTAAAFGLFVLSACSGGGQSDEFIEACTTSSELGAEICACVADLAEDELSEAGFAFLIASMQGDTDQAAQLAAELPFEEATTAGLFMISAPTRCAAP